MKARVKPVVNDGKFHLPEKYQLFLMLLPFLIFVFIFSYLPLSGWRYAFICIVPALT